MIYHIAEYKFRITIEDGKRMIQCDYPPYNVKTISWVKCLKNDMDNIHSYCKDMFDDASLILLGLEKQWNVKNAEVLNESNSTLVQ